MSDRVAPVAVHSFSFESSDPAREKETFFARLREFGQGCHWTPPIENEVELILEEWWANLINYALVGNPQPRVAVRIEAQPAEAQIEIQDNGIPFDPTQHPDPDFTLPPEERPIGGLGIYMIKKLSRGLRSERSGQQNILRLEKDLVTPVLGQSKPHS